MSSVFSQLPEQLGASPVELLAVVLSAIGIYLVFLVLVRIFGPRSLHGMSTFDAILVIAFGAVTGRAILGPNPTLAEGAVGLLTLFMMEALFGQLRATVRGMRVLNARPVVVMAGQERLTATMRRIHLTEAELTSALRRAGVRSATEVGCVVFEPTGHLSVLRRGELIDPALLDGVDGADLVPTDLLRGGAGR